MLPKTLRPVLFAVMAASGLLLGLRAAIGPFSWPVRVNSPLNLESWCALAAVLAFALRTIPATAKPAAGRLYRFIPVLAAVVAAAYARALGFYLFSDDFIVVQLGRTLQYDFHRLFATGGGDGFFRPLGYISLGLTGVWANGNPVLWHAATLAVHLANAVLVLSLAWKVTASRAAAAIAAILFAIHGTRPEVAVWIAGRFDLIATFFVLAGLVLFLRAGAVSKALSLVCMVLGILSKESAYAFPLLAALLLWAQGQRKCRAYAVLVPFLVAAAALFAYRWVLFGGLGGYPGSFALLPSLKALALRVWAALFFPVNWSAGPGVFLGALLVVYVAALLLLAACRARFNALLPVGFVLIACVPPLNQLLIAADLQKSRMLYLPSVGFCLLLGLAISQLRAVRWRVLTAAAVFAFHLAALEHNLNIWAGVSSKIRQACEAAAQYGPFPAQPPGLPGDLQGVPFFANGFPNCAAMQSRAVRRKPGSPVWNVTRKEIE